MAAMFILAGAGWYSFGVFFKPVMSDFGWSRTQVSVAIFILGMGMGLFSPVVGRLTDQWGARTILLSGTVVTGCGFLFLSIMKELWHYYAICIFLALGLTAIGVVPIAILIANWFERRRGLALGITTVGISLGALVLPPILERLIVWMGWRFAYISLGGLTCALLLPVISLIVRTRPLCPISSSEVGLQSNKGEEALSQDANRSKPRRQLQEANWTLQSAFKTPVFWLVMICTYGICVATDGTLLHEVNFLTDQGVSATLSAMAMALTGGIGGIGKVVFGLMADRFQAKYVASVCFALQAVGLLLLMNASTMPMIWLFVVVFGIAMGGVVTLIPLLVAEYFGLKSFSILFGIVHLALMFGSASGPLLSGIIFDATQSYNWAFTAFVAIQLISAIAICIGRTPKKELDVR